MTDYQNQKMAVVERLNSAAAAVAVVAVAVVVGMRRE